MRSIVWFGKQLGFVVLISSSIVVASSVSARELPSELVPTVNTIAQALGNNNDNSLDGTWDYQVSLPTSQCSVQGACSIKIVGNVGHYVLPTNNTDNNRNGVFLVNVYPTTINRGLPVVTITGVGVTGSEITYSIVHSGRLDQPGLITGRFVDVVNNTGTFTLTKQP